MSEPRFRFDVVVWNHERLRLFVDNFHRIRRFDPEQDRLTIVSASPSPDELALLDRFAAETGIRARYLPRRNLGLAELARIEYFTGAVGDFEENLSSRQIFQLQDHYLEIEDAASRWPDGGVKSDVAPDDAVFDLDEIDDLFRRHDLDGAFCDRLGPTRLPKGMPPALVPAGGNFVLRTDLLRRGDVQRTLRRLARVRNERYEWATYVELMWGALFFGEGERLYDLRRGALVQDLDPSSFLGDRPDYTWLAERYGTFAPYPLLWRAVHRPEVQRVIRGVARRRSAAARGRVTSR